MAEEIEGEYFVLKDKNQENPLARVDHTALKEYKVHRSNQDKHTLRRCRNLFRILLKTSRETGQQNSAIYQEMAMNGIEVVLGTDSSVFCNLRDIHRLLQNFNNVILWMDLVESTSNCKVKL